MVASRVRRHKAENPPKLEPRVVRAALCLRGETLADVAHRHGVRRQMVDKLLRGHRPGRSGKSAAIMRELREVAG